MLSLLQSKTFHNLLGLTVSVLLIGWLVSEIDMSSVGGLLAQGDYWWLIPATILLVLHFVLRAWRWLYLLPGGEEVSLRERFDAILVGCLANFVLPLRAGEFIRPFLLSRRTPVSFAKAFATIVTERFFDLACVLLCFAIVIQRVSNVPEWVYTGAWSLGVVSCIILLFILFGIFTPGLVRKWFQPFAKVLPDSISRKLSSFLEDFLISAQVLAHKGNLLKTVLLTGVIWVSNFLLFWVLMLVFDIPPSLWIAVTVAVVVALGVALPSAPGFIGVIQTTCVAGFALYGVAKPEALAYSIVLHIHQYIFFVGYGMYVLSRSGLRLGELRNRAVQQAA